jgi:hypothetical protein
MPNAFSFLSGQKSRGIQIESVGAMPFHLARHLGWSGTWAAKDGSHEFVGPYVESVSLIMRALTVLAFGWLLWWRRRSDLGRSHVLPDAALTATLLFVVTSRVISPQYMVWLIGLAAVCLLRPDTTQRPVAYLLLAACVLTTLDFPLLYRELRDDGALWPSPTCTPATCCWSRQRCCRGYGCGVRPRAHRLLPAPRPRTAIWRGQGTRAPDPTAGTRAAVPFAVGVESASLEELHLREGQLTARSQADG